MLAERAESMCQAERWIFLPPTKTGRGSMSSTLTVHVSSWPPVRITNRASYPSWPRRTTQPSDPAIKFPLLVAEAGDSQGMAEERFLAAALDAAKSAGEIIRKGFYLTKNVEHKGQVDLVTETDKACEDLIFNHLRKLYPDHKFIGEETSAALGSTADLTDEPTWIVDPLDGTTNFVHGFPFVCVSIGLTIGKIPTVGVVYNPIMNELFTAVRGKGAFLNGSPIKTSPQDELMKALMVTEVGTKRDKSTLDNTTNRINKLLFKVRSIRMCGSLALNMCGVACGRLDLCYEIGFGGPWDVAAGALILQEAGGFVFDPSGGEFDLMAQRMAGSNGYLKDEFIKALGDAS